MCGRRTPEPAGSSTLCRLEGLPTAFRRLAPSRADRAGRTVASVRRVSPQIEMNSRRVSAAGPLPGVVPAAQLHRSPFRQINQNTISITTLCSAQFALLSQTVVYFAQWLISAFLPVLCTLHMERCSEVAWLHQQTALSNLDALCFEAASPTHPKLRSAATVQKGYRQLTAVGTYSGVFRNPGRGGPQEDANFQHEGALNVEMP